MLQLVHAQTGSKITEIGLPTERPHCFAGIPKNHYVVWLVLLNYKVDSMQEAGLRLTLAHLNLIVGIYTENSQLFGKHLAMLRRNTNKSLH
jgi:hypothetical protein